MNRQFTIHIARFAILALLIVLFGSCRRAPLSPRLTDINTLAETAPQAALDSLHSINPDTLSERDRNYYDFLTVKCERKAYLPIESDSLILKVIDYASRHQADGYYPEALYTGGLVYSDIGDQPTALEYFFQANNEVSNDESELLLKQKILSQIGRLLTNLRQTTQANQYILEAGEVAKLRHDTLSIIMENQLLARNLQRSGAFQEADSILRTSIDMGYPADPSRLAGTYMCLAVGLSHDQRHKEGLAAIRCCLDNVSEPSRNIAFAHAADIYLQAGILDSAYHFADRIIHTPVGRSVKDNSKTSAYEVLLNPRIRHLVPPDSIDHYYAAYANLLDHYYNENDNELVINRINSYNYLLHQQKQLEAENFSYKLGGLIAILLVIMLGITCWALKLKIKKDRQLLRLYHALDIINGLTATHPHFPTHTTVHSDLILDRTEGGGYDADNPAIRCEEPEEIQLRRQLQASLRKMYEINPAPIIDARIKDSAIYDGFVKAATENRVILEESREWIGLENLILTISPKFKSTLQILAGGKMNEADYHTSLLVKCGLKQAQIGIIMGRVRSGINHRLKSLGYKLFDGEVVNPKVIEVLIRLI